MKTIVIGLLLFAFIATARPASNEVGAVASITPSPMGIGVEFAGGNEEFFPPDAFQLPTNTPSFKTTWYSKHLSAMREPSLFRMARTDSNAVYRFTWLRSFHEPVAVRLTVHADGSGDLHGVMLDGKGGYEPGKIKKSVDKKLKEKDTQDFQKRFALIEFWDRSITDNEKGCWQWAPVRNSWMRIPTIGCDGAQWIMEASVSNRYNIIERWTPESGALREAALELIRLSNLNVGEIY